MGGLHRAGGQNTFAAGNLDQRDVGGRFDVAVAPVDRGREIFRRTAYEVVKARIAEPGRRQRDERTFQDR